MTNDWGQPKDYHNIFVESENAAELRTKRIWRFVSVMWATWLFFACYLTLRGYAPAAITCSVILLLLTVMNGCTYRFWTSRRVMAANLTLSAIGLFSVAVSDPAMHATMLFYPVSILVTSQLFGIRGAIVWALITSIAFLVFFLTAFGMESLLTRPTFDQLILLQGVAACTFFCCQQGEEYYLKRTSALIQLSQDLKSQHARLETLATTDALTGLINRFQFQVRLRERIEQCHLTSTRAILYVIDMNGFKEVNDTLGHPVGDEALIEIGSRLKEQFSGQFEVARLGGDEFCIIAGDELDDEAADQLAQQIARTLHYRYHSGDVEFPLSASVGYCVCPDHALNAKDLFSFADTAMFYAKENKLPSAIYHRSMTERLMEHRTLQDKLSLALARDEFFLVYQPQVDISSGKITGVEALIRWRCDGQIIPPNRFIPLLERGGEIRLIGSWVIREACRQWAAWNADGLVTKISINVSAVQFKDKGFIPSIEQCVQEFSVNPNCLDFEITEGLLIDDIAEAVRKLRQLKAIGATISIDDFGTGYSSLSYLRQFPIDRLKIDRVFVKDYPQADDGIIASSIIVLAKTLELKVLAEGVELQEQLDFLKLHDCDEYQGYLFSQPVSADEITTMMQASISASNGLATARCTIVDLPVPTPTSSMTTI